MLLNLSKIIDCPGVVPFETALDLSDLSFGGCCPAQEPVVAKGTVKNSAGVLLMHGTVETTLHGVCDRCAKPFTREKTVEYETLLATELENGENDDIVLLDRDCQLDLDELLGDVFILDLDTKNLCSPDCKGICAGCGANLNEEPCRCKREIDPRLAKLAQLLERDDRT